MGIKIHIQIDRNSMGDGWKNYDDAAKGFAGYYKDMIENKLRESFHHSDITVSYEVGIISKTTVDCDNYDHYIETKNIIEYVESDAWDNWRTSNEAIEY